MTKKTFALFGGGEMLPTCVTFCWTDSQIDNPWFKCTWWKWPIFSTVKMYRGKNNMPIPVTHVNVGASCEFSCGSILSLMVLNVTCLFQRLKKSVYLKNRQSLSYYYDSLFSVILFQRSPYLLKICCQLISSIQFLKYIYKYKYIYIYLYL